MVQRLPHPAMVLRRHPGTVHRHLNRATATARRLHSQVMGTLRLTNRPTGSPRSQDTDNNLRNQRTLSHPDNSTARHRRSSSRYVMCLTVLVVR